MLDKEPLCVLLPVALDQDEVRELENLARGVRPARDVFVNQPLELVFDTAPQRDVPVELKVIGHGHERPVLAHSLLTLRAHQSRLIAENVCRIADGYHGVHLTIGSGPGSVTRVIDAGFLANISPSSLKATLKDRKRQALEYSARFGADRVARIIAMMETGYQDQASFDRIMEATLASIDAREDCSDFIMVPLLWLLGAYAAQMPAGTVDRIKHSVLSYRYWVDEPGNDAMWFWSENHVLCFTQANCWRGFSCRRRSFQLRAGQEDSRQSSPPRAWRTGSTVWKHTALRNGIRLHTTRSTSSGCWRWSAGLRRPLPSARVRSSISFSG
ncbi:hypothetical protein AJ87_36985 [Rhizobium yanglingense]|nr:hypothetical protein AJ87_36985 [Rhizobium yanglingense]